MRSVFRLEGEYWTIAYGGDVRRFRNRRGFELLAELLRQPGQRIAAIDLGVRGRTAPTAQDDIGDEARERARINVTRAIKDTLGRIRAHLPQLASHFDATVRTGSQCVYWPDPRLPIKWEVHHFDPFKETAASLTPALSQRERVPSKFPAPSASVDQHEVECRHPGESRGPVQAESDAWHS